VRRLQRAELLDDQEPEDDDRAAGVKEVLPPLPQAYAAQRSEVDRVIGKFCNLAIGNLRGAVFKLPNYSISKLLNQNSGA
jgi:hypothetical protein